MPREDRRSPEEGSAPELPSAEGVGAPVASDSEHRSEVLGMARQGGVTSLGAIFNQTLRFGITFLLARLLGAAGAGLYYQAFALLSFLGLVAAGGFTLTLTRYVAVHRADNDDGGLRGTVRLGLVTTTLIATALSVGLYISSPWLAQNAFHDLRLTTLIRFAAVALPATVFADAALSATRGFKTMRPYALINLFFEPACRVVLTVVALVLGWGLPGVMVALVVTNWTSALLASIALKRLMGLPTSPPRYNVREIFAFSGASWFSNLAGNGLLWADTILLGIYGSATAVGIYQVATRLTLLGTALINPVTTSFSPRIADLWRRGRHDLLRKTYTLITGWVFRLALPSFVILLVFPRELLLLFGPRFESGVSVTVIMTLAWVFNALSGPSGYMLTMSGRPVFQMVNNVAALVLNVALNVWLIPRYGVVGAAAAWATSVVLVTTARVWQVWSFAKILPLSRDLLKGVVAGLGAAVAAFAVREVVGGVSSLFIGSVLVGAVYIASIALLGVDKDDRLVLSSLRRRLRWRSA